ncbi:HprK-related kinase A [Thauera sinica]|uniref:HprK-related kinase A n=1 Tax=Thauera sinica TaxID=2665146 RepID=A0ABW1AR37_9RHOO|nr:HprK-related kinase A [Thauera sp. K11]ATE59015.1 HprK-related kinase A [Thauera sp. K11]
MLDTVLRIPPFNVRVRSPFAAVARHLHAFYADAGIPADGAFVDFDLRILPGTGLRRWWHPQARLELDGIEPFLPLPADQAAPLFEWGLNWSIASRALGYLVMHAAVLARNGEAVVMPGFPGAGKSTLCASLAFLERWQLLSDELAILDPAAGHLVPHPRPISLKNESIDIVSRFDGAWLGRQYPDTRKGTVSHAAVPAASRASAESPARCRWVVFPRFEAGCEPFVEEIPRAEAFALISEQSFNKERMGETGFVALCAMLDGARCYHIEYGSTADGLRLIGDICGS